MKYLILALMIINTACGSSPATIQSGIPEDIQCEVRDSCTHADVPGYQCEAVKWMPNLGSGADLPKAFYGDAPCVITKEDFETTPGCDPLNPNQVCGSWGGKPYPCCQTVQGPGEASLLN